MRVKISTNAPLPLVRVWFPLAHASTATISSFKSLLCASLPAFGGVSPSSLRLSIDGFELLDMCDLTIVRDGDLISVDVHDAPAEDARTRDRVGQAVEQSVTAARLESASSHKRKRRTPTPSSTSSESDTTESESESESETSGSDDSSERSEPGQVQARVPYDDACPDSTFVAPGYGKPQTRARNLRRRLKRMHERGSAGVSGGGPVSGANAVEQAVPETGQDTSLMSLSLRNKNKAKNFRSLLNRPLPAKIIFGDEESASTSTSARALPRLVPPSLRTSLPPNVFVTRVDVEGGRRKTRDEHAEDEVDTLESMARARWATLEKVTRGSALQGALVAYKALGIDPATFTPGEVLTVARVEISGAEGLVVLPMHAAEFHCPDGSVTQPQQHTWDEIDRGDWRILHRH